MTGTPTEPNTQSSDVIGRTPDWANRCPKCGHQESRDSGPGRTDSCPECGWPMHCIDLEVAGGETA